MGENQSIGTGISTSPHLADNAGKTPGEASVDIDMSIPPTRENAAAILIEPVMGEGGVEGCGKAQNCVEVCPKEIPLVDSLAVVGRETTKRMLLGWLLK